MSDIAVSPTSPPLAAPAIDAHAQDFAARLTLAATHRLAEVEAAWRSLAAAGRDQSPGQNFDFVRLWIAAQHIAEKDCLFVTAKLDGRPLVLLPLCRRTGAAGRVYGFFPGRHVGCNAPLVDACRLAALGAAERKTLWQALRARLRGADLLHLQAVPAAIDDKGDLFSELGRSLPVETLHRARFASWAEADAAQRNKSRRKHDRQQGDKLAGFGEVSFEVVRNDAAAPAVMAEMFRQRARRFAAMGIRDPFAPQAVARFYAATALSGSGVDVYLHVLRLAGDIVAVRYSIASGDRLFCLISAMSEDPAIQAGSPGKQCLLRMVQTVFDEGFSTLDLGAGQTDEKRQWCNEQIGLRDHFVALSPQGALLLEGRWLWQALRARIKANPRLRGWIKAARGRLTGRLPAAGN